MRLDLAAVGALVRGVSREELLPRHRRLASHQIFAKASEQDPDDIVTEADLALEQRLGPELTALLPGSTVVGEEAAAADPTLLKDLAGERPCWVIDPLDGTKNFAAGSDAFGTMVALARNGETLAAWIYLPIADQLYSAERGAGAFCGGERLDAREPPPSDPPVGTLYTGFMPEPTRAAVLAAAAGTFAPRPIPGSAAIEYTTLVRGGKDFVVYFRLHPWDHAPGALILHEAGGTARGLDGIPYRPTARHGVTLVTRDASRWEELRRRLGLRGA